MASAGRGSGRAFDSGLYQLVVRLPRARAITVGHLGRFLFPAGYYVYTGSARRGLEARVARHTRRRKRMRWHIDYLLRHGAVIEVKRYGIGGLSECELSRRVEELPGSGVVAPGFGSSDCGCATHLIHFRRNPAQELGQAIRPGGSLQAKTERPTFAPPLHWRALGFDGVDRAGVDRGEAQDGGVNREQEHVEAARLARNEARSRGPRGLAVQVVAA